MTKTGFDRFVDEQMSDPEFADAYRKARAEIDSVDALVRAIDEAREREGLTKSEMAKRVGMPATSIRRLFTTRRPNPSFSTVMGLLSSVGYSLRVVRREGTASRRTGRGDARAARRSGRAARRNVRRAR